MPSEYQTARELDSVDWEGVQGIVRAFRQALDRGERPALETYLPDVGARRKNVLIELVHEEMEFRITAGEDSVLESYLERFPEIGDDPQALAELISSASNLQRGVAEKAADGPALSQREIEWRSSPCAWTVMS